jgi:NAD(P)H-dependent FMN reductase
MIRISIISPSVRTGRNSHRAALYINNLLREKNIAECEILDLLKYKFPLFEERLKYIESPSAGMVEFSDKIRQSDGVIIVVPEYNGGYPASLKNAVDFLTDEWRKKPVAFIPVSDGNFGGSQAITSFQFSMWKIRAITVYPFFRIPDIADVLDENGKPLLSKAAEMDKRASGFINELLWHIEAKRRMAE